MSSSLRLFNTLSQGYRRAFIKLFNACARGYDRALVEKPQQPVSPPLPTGIDSWRTRRRTHGRDDRHKKNIGQAGRVLATFESWEGDGLTPRMLGYLRKIDPYVFEELILTVLDRQGIIVTRNASYSGDGGLDGEFCYEGGRFLVQAKRYKGAINTGHVEAFARLIDTRRADGGLFIHTGRTPSGAYKQMGRYGNITLVSGGKLAALIRGERFTLWTGQKENAA